MIDGLKPYPAYKDSGVPWLLNLPSDWTILRAKNVFTVIDIRSETGGEELLTVSATEGVIPRSQKTVTMFKAESYVGHKLCWPGDLVINSLWAWMQGLGFSRYHGLVSSAYGVYRPNSRFTRHALFLNYLIRSYAYKWELLTRSKGVWLSRLQLSDPAFLDMPILLPPVEDVERIVRFLDHADSRIRRYIRAKKKLIALLNEQKQAIIHHAVTRGLDRNVKLKPSGVEWLGDVPEHWDSRSAKQVSQVFIPQRDKPELNEQDGFPWITPEYVGATYVAQSRSFVTQDAARSSGSRAVPAGSVIANCIGRFGIASINETPVIINQQLQAYLPTPTIDARFLRYCVQVAKPYFEMKGNSTTLAYVNRQGFGDMPLAYPPRAEQEAIVGWIEGEEARVSSAAQNANREISLLREFRIRLIADVVTGKLDVCKAASRLPEEVEEPQAIEEPEEFTEFDEELEGEELEEAVAETG